MPYYVYILQSELDGTYYIGSTQNLAARLERHNQGRSQYAKSKCPWKIVYYEEFPDDEIFNMNAIGNTYLKN